MTKRRPRLCASSLLAALLATASGEASTLSSPGCLAGGQAATVTEVDDRLDVHLSDGRTIHLPGIAMPATAEETRTALQAWLTQTSVAVRLIRPEPDRWGRVDALLFAGGQAEGAGAVSITEALLDAGHAMARPDPDLEGCWPAYLALEDGARRAHRGLWSAPTIVDPADGAALEAHEGRLAIVAGRIRTAYPGRTRLYLRFAGSGGTGMAAALPLPLVRRLAKGGQDPQSWVGHELRVRGLLDRRWGWQIEVTTPRQIELDPP